MTRKTYEVLTWDIDKEGWTPQQGVRRGPYSLMGLRKALRALRKMGYDIKRHCAFWVLVQKRV